MEYIYSHFFLVELGALTLAAITASALLQLLFHRFEKKAAQTSHRWGEALLYAAGPPLKTYIWVSYLLFSLMILGQVFSQVDAFFSPWIKSAHQVAGIALLLVTFLRFIDRFEKILSAFHPSGYDHPTTRGIIRFLKIFVFSIIGLGVLQLFGIPLSGLVAFGGVGGIAVGFAAKDLMSNLFGRLVIFLDRQFEVGDWIRSSEKPIEGAVEHIGLRVTQVRTIDQRPLFVPNSIFSNITLENASRMQRRRILATIGLNYEDFSKIEPILAEIVKFLKGHPEVDTSTTYFANLVNFAPHALEIQVCAFTKATQTLKFQKVQQDILLNIMAIIHQQEARVAYPARLATQSV